MLTGHYFEFTKTVNCKKLFILFFLSAVCSPTANGQFVCLGSRKKTYIPSSLVTNYHKYGSSRSIRVQNVISINGKLFQKHYYYMYNEYTHCLPENSVS